MGDEGIAAVADAGPLIHLYEVGLLDLAEAEEALGRLYDTSTLFVARALIDQAILALRRLGRPA